MAGMTPENFLGTSVLLGLFVVAAGAYGVLYCAGKLREDRRLIVAAYASFAVLCAIAAAIVVTAPLDFGWKLLIGASALVYFAIPPVTWNHLRRTHRDHGERV